MVRYPRPTSVAATNLMKGNRRTDTKPEVRLRSALHALGLRFRKDLPIRTPERVVRPGIVFTRPRIAVFVDGCFWHGCPEHGTTPRANTEHWGPKLQCNQERDALVDAALSGAGWIVLRYWEHEPVDAVAAQVAAAIWERSGPTRGRRNQV